MKRTLKIQIFEDGKLVREIAEDNTIVITEGKRIVALGNLSLPAALQLTVETDETYSIMRDIIKQHYHISEEELSQYLAFTKICALSIKTEIRGDGNG